MKITPEELDNVILKRYEDFNIELKRKTEIAEICANSIEFAALKEAFIIIFNSGDKTIKELIYNCLLTGITLGYYIAEDKLEVQQLEEICGIIEEGDPNGDYQCP